MPKPIFLKREKSSVNQDEKNLRILEITTDIRKFEIGLLWSRSLFFWGFTTVAIGAYGAAHSFGRAIQFAIACAGLICSVIWTLVNRSSKYWQKIWEEKAESASRKVIGGNLFAEHRPPRLTCRNRIRNFPWWSAHFSVSKLATAFSDFTALAWVALAFKASSVGTAVPSECVIPTVAACTVIYIVYIFIFCRPDPPGNSN